jgi:hypothetical protein
VYRTNPAWAVIGVALLALRYRRTHGTPRKQIRWLLFGIDEPARRAFVHRVLRVSIGVVLAVLAGVMTSLVAPVAVAVAAGQRARPFGPVWNTSPIDGYSARGWRATPASAASARA